VTRILFEDAELDDILIQESDTVLAAAARACEMLAVRFARDFDFSADGASFHKSTISAHYQKMAQRLRVRATGTVVVMPRRIDGYSNDINSDEVSTVTASVYLDG
jgi:hypothetical protein